jgi:predicted enzyme related to lactoylglutathione lyase
MPINPAGWFEIYVQDMPRAKKFYEAVLQVELKLLNASSPELWSFP